MITDENTLGAKMRVGRWSHNRVRCSFVECSWLPSPFWFWPIVMPTNMKRPAWTFTRHDDDEAASSVSSTHSILPCATKATYFNIYFEVSGPRASVLWFLIGVWRYLGFHSLIILQLRDCWAKYYESIFWDAMEWAYSIIILVCKGQDDRN